MTDPTRRRLVLLVEDDEVVRAPLEKFLKISRFDVVSAGTVAEALLAISRHHPTAAIIDIRLPGGSGREVVAALPEHVPAIIFSGVPEESRRLEELRPHTRLIAKPYSLTLLVETLEKMLAEAARETPSRAAADDSGDAESRKQR